VGSFVGASSDGSGLDSGEGNSVSSGVGASVGVSDGPLLGVFVAIGISSPGGSGVVLGATVSAFTIIEGAIENSIVGCACP
jgi:hypothetical protein